jgi:hypothetical protein
MVWSWSMLFDGIITYLSTKVRVKNREWNDGNLDARYESRLP